ncbi:MAG: 50S ribosomal protein L9 [Acidobacteriota bacterium]|nr:50S ribosomal protein L9 [Acidobacteriota bacterium]
MDVVLRERIEKLGDRGEVVAVKPGYARNYLLPKRKAVLATPHNVRQVEQEKAAAVRREAIEKNESEMLAQQIAEVSLQFTRKVGEQDVLYGSVTSLEIAESLHERGFEIDRRKIDLEEPLKSLGGHNVPIKLHREVTAVVSVEVLREE